MFPSAKVNGVWPFNDAWLCTSLEEARRHATLPRSWIQRENWEFETHTPPAAPAGCPGSDRLRGQPHRHIAASNKGLIVGRPVRNAVLRLRRGMDLRLHPCSVAPAEGHEKCGPNRPTPTGYSCNNASAPPRATRPALRPPRGVVARIVTGPHDAHRQDPHLPMRYDTGRPRGGQIRLRQKYHDLRPAFRLIGIGTQGRLINWLTPCPLSPARAEPPGAMRLPRPARGVRCTNRHWPARCPPTGSSPADAV